MRKKILIPMTSLLLFCVSCNKQKEQELKQLINKEQSTAANTNSLNITLATDAADKNPNYENLINAGLTLSKANQPDKAIVYFRRASAADPKNSIPYNNLCAENNALGRWTTSIQNCEKALALAPEFQLAKNNLNFAKDKKAQQLASVEKLKANLKKYKGHEHTAQMIDLGYEYYKMGEYEEAISIWKKTGNTNSTSQIIVLNNLASAYIFTQKFDLAKLSLEEGLKLDPKNDLTKNNLAWLKLESERK